MEVQTVIEESWATGEQTIDIGQHFPGCPYIINFYIDVINFEQVCEPTGDTYPVRREYYAHTSPAAKGKKIDSFDFHFKIVSFYRKYHPFFPAKNAHTL